jgi:hypothetical protein
MACLQIALLAAMLASLLLGALASDSIMLQVEPKTEECFHIDVSVPDSFTVIFTVTRGGKLDIYLTVCPRALPLFAFFMIFQSQL